MNIIFLYLFTILATVIQSHQDILTYGPKNLARLTLELGEAGEDKQKQREVFKMYGFPRDTGPIIYRQMIRDLKSHSRNRVIFYNEINVLMSKIKYSQD
ncbi:MAG TPA: hypothetical protein ENI73_03555 [Spirochaetes bacterium]|nr:hypothetical protein [Spirochaetota bacterium]